MLQVTSDSLDVFIAWMGIKHVPKSTPPSLMILKVLF